MSRILVTTIWATMFFAIIACQPKKPEAETFTEEQDSAVADLATDVFSAVGPAHIKIVPTMQATFGDSNTVHCSNFEYLWNSIMSHADRPITGNTFVKQLSRSTTWTNSMDTSKVVLALGKPVEVYNSIIRQYKTKYKRVPADLSPQGSSFWAYTDKQVGYKYAEPFDEQRLLFLGTEVSGFGFDSGFGSGYIKDYFRGQYKVLYYNTKREFVVQLIPENTTDEIMLIMINKRGTFIEMFDASRKMINDGAKELKRNGAIYNLSTEDELVIPAIRFEASLNYRELQGVTFSSKYGAIDEVTQRIKFGFDRLGIELESNASMADSVGPPSKPKILRFDKPFYLYIKEARANHPYFNLWVSDTEILEKN